jgi:hypothetical protein
VPRIDPDAFYLYSGTTNALIAAHQRSVLPIVVSPDRALHNVQSMTAVQYIDPMILGIARPIGVVDICVLRAVLRNCIADGDLHLTIIEAWVFLLF